MDLVIKNKFTLRQQKLIKIVDSFWVINALEDQYKYVFRASALNEYGWSNTSEESSEFDLNIAAQIAEKQDPISLIVIAGLPLMICLVIIILVICCK